MMYISILKLFLMVYISADIFTLKETNNVKKNAK